MDLTPTFILQDAVEKGRWQGGQEMTERERALATQLLYLHAQVDSMSAQLDAVQGQYRHG